ncbi:hypothetical protein D3C72_1872090 [compost metagenome]
MHDGRDGEAAFGVLDGGRQDVGERQAAQLFVQRAPARHATRDGDAIPAAGRDGALVLAAEIVHVPGGRRRPGCIEAVQPGAVPDDGKAVRSQAVADRLGQRQRGCRGDCRVHRVAPLRQDPQACLGGQRLRRGDDIAGKYGRTGRRIGILPVESHGESSCGVNP